MDHEFILPNGSYSFKRSQRNNGPKSIDTDGYEIYSAFIGTYRPNRDDIMNLWIIEIYPDGDIWAGPLYGKKRMVRE